MPIMTMDDIRLEVDVWQNFQDSPVEESEAFPIIPITINPIPTIIKFVIDEVDGNPFKSKFFNSAVLGSPG
ncbi:hypothetical protein D3C72_1021910 [compost metagenome]